MSEDTSWVSNVPKIDLRNKESVSIRVDRDVLNYFRSTGKGYQTRMNAVLRAFVNHQLSQKDTDHG